MEFSLFKTIMNIYFFTNLYLYYKFPLKIELYTYIPTHAHTTGGYIAYITG